MTSTPDQPVPSNANALLLQAIALRKCITATYNRMVCTLAPHILFTKHDDVFVDAVRALADEQGVSLEGAS